MSNFRLFAFFMLVISLSLVNLAPAENPDVIFSAHWGGKTASMGIMHKPEMEIGGPLSFCTDGKDVFILDSVHKRIVGVDAGGQAKVIAKDVVGWGICADGVGGVYVQNGRQILHIDAGGKTKGRYLAVKKADTSKKFVEGYGMDMFVDSAGYLCARSLSQKAYRVSGVPRLHAPLGGAGESLSLQYKIKRMSGNKVRIIGLDADGKALVSVPVRLDGGQVGAAIFKGTDAKGNLYVELENINGRRVGLEVHRYAPSGKRLAVYKLPNNYFTTVYKKTEIAPDGSVYQMLTTPDGVRIIRY